MGEQPLFGRWLFQAEQEWIARRINRHLDNPDWEEVQINEETELEYSLMDGFAIGED